MSCSLTTFALHHGEVCCPACAEKICGISPTQLTLDARSPCVSSSFETALRLLDARCPHDQRSRFHTAVKDWVHSNGSLPEGVTLKDASVEVAAAVEEDAPVVPSHRVLCTNYSLKSRAFMLTFNSPLFAADTWPLFLEHVQGLVKKLGVRIWAACFERSLKGSRVSHHGHCYFIWTDGVGSVSYTHLTLPTKRIV